VKDINFEIIIIDNCSSDNISEQLLKYPKVNFYRNEKNLGFGKACNLGAEYAKGKYLFFVNSDIVLQGNPIKPMVEFYEKNDCVGIIGGQLKFPNEKYQKSSYGFPSISKRLLELLGIKKFLTKDFLPKPKGLHKFIRVQAVKGAFFVISKTLFQKIGKFDEFYFMYVEDIDLSYQVKLFNYENYLYLTDSIVHLGWNVENPADSFGFINRNRGLIYFYKKNYSNLRTKIFVILNLISFSIKRYFVNEDISENFLKVISLYKKELKS